MMKLTIIFGILSLFGDTLSEDILGHVGDIDLHSITAYGNGAVQFDVEQVGNDVNFHLVLPFDIKRDTCWIDITYYRYNQRMFFASWKLLDTLNDEMPRLWGKVREAFQPAIKKDFIPAGEYKGQWHLAIEDVDVPQIAYGEVKITLDFDCPFERAAGIEMEMTSTPK